jgi:hypothetical protein
MVVVNVCGDVWLMHGGHHSWSGVVVQAKPTNPVSWQEVHLGVRFFQILTEFVKINQKTHLQSFSHNVLRLAKILGPKTTSFCHGKPGLGSEIHT